MNAFNPGVKQLECGRSWWTKESLFMVRNTLLHSAELCSMKSYKSTFVWIYNFASCFTTDRNTVYQITIYVGRAHALMGCRSMYFLKHILTLTSQAALKNSSEVLEEQEIGSVSLPGRRFNKRFPLSPVFMKRFCSLGEALSPCTRPLQSGYGCFIIR